MAENQPGLPVVRFGAFEVHLAAGELRKNGLKVKLQEQPFQVLALLLERRGEVVTREELREQLWPADTFVDFDHSLGTAIKKIRQALGDSATNPRFVETLPKRGYRFIAPIQTGADASVAETVPAASSRKLWYAAAAVLGIALVVAIVVGSRSLAPVTRSDDAPLTPVPLTSDIGLELSPSFSPDGNEIVYAWNGADQADLDLYIKTIGSPSQRPLTDTPGDEFSPAWSPDGRQIAFLRYDPEGRVSLNVMPSTGGFARPLGEVMTHEFFFPLDLIAPHLAWTPDSSGVILSDKTTAAGAFCLFLVSLDSGERRPLTEPDGGSGDWHPALSPDGKTLAFARSVGAVGRIHTLTLSEDFEPLGKPRRLMKQEGYYFQPSWTPDGTTILFSSLIGGARQIWSVTSGGGRPRSLALPGDDLSRPAVSPQGNRLAYVRGHASANIYRLAIQADTEDKEPPVPVLPSTQNDYDPRYSPDGKWIAFGSNRSNPPGIWVAAADGSDERLLYASERAKPGSPRWSPDSQRLVFDLRIPAEGNQTELFVINVEGGQAVPLASSPYMDAVGSWSRNGRWIYFCSDRSGRNEVWKVSAGGEEPEQVTQGGGGPAFESADGMLYYVKYFASRTSLWKIPVGGGEEQLVLEPVLAWAFEPTENGIYYIEPPGRGYSIRYFDLRTGTSRTLWQLPLGTTPMWSLSVAPDETDLVFVQRDLGSSDIWLVENFRQAGTHQPISSFRYKPSRRPKEKWQGQNPEPLSFC